MLTWLARTLLLLLGATAQAYDFQAIAEQHIIPGYQRLAEHTASLSNTAEGYCTQPKTANLGQLQAGYKTTFLAWQGVQHLRFGPGEYLLREHRFALWPDQRGTVGKHLRRLLDDPQLLAPDFDISQKSVAVQGFSALERLLFGAAASHPNGCRLLTVIGANLQMMADNLVADWSTGAEPYIAYFAQPGPDNAVFQGPPEVAGQLINSLQTQLELMVTQKLARPLGSSLERARGRRAEGWRSRSALAALAANLRACHALYRGVFAPELPDHPVDQRLESSFAEAQAILEKIELPLSQAVVDPQQRLLVEQLQATLARLKQLVARELTATLDLALGFNSLDGD